MSVADATRDVIDTVTVGFVDPTLRLRIAEAAAVTVQIVPGPAEETLAGRAGAPARDASRPDRGSHSAGRRSRF